MFCFSYNNKYRVIMRRDTLPLVHHYATHPEPNTQFNSRENFHHDNDIIFIYKLNITQGKKKIFVLKYVLLKPTFF